MTDPSSAEGRRPGTAPGADAPEAARAPVQDLWLGRLMRLLGMVIAVGLWLLVAELVVLRWLG